VRRDVGLTDISSFASVWCACGQVSYWAVMQRLRYEQPPLFLNVHMTSAQVANHWIDSLAAFWPGLQVGGGWPAGALGGRGGVAAVSLPTHSTMTRATENSPLSLAVTAVTRCCCHGLSLLSLCVCVCVCVCV
jgi:hypothetical protein